ncbi:MAG TPA: class I SAM-dependent methyltransferase [Tahibacter sp.]|nr:class I SAM-dependent methyltransferase [Tahibacter sp.]
MRQISQKNLIRTYRYYAPLYDVLFGAILEPGRRRLADAVNALRPRRLLEVGVGTGLTLPRYSRDIAIVGIDVSDEMLRRARGKAASLDGAPIALQRMDGERMAFADASFDCVVVPYTYSVTPNPAALVAELRRVCAPGGTIMLLNHFGGSRYWILFDKLFRAFADKLGFRADFSYEEQVLAHDWRVRSVVDVNLLGLSKLVVIDNVSRNAEFIRVSSTREANVATAPASPPR